MGSFIFAGAWRIEFLGKTAEADKEFEKARTLKADRAELMRAGDAHAESARWDIAAKYYGWAAEAPDAPAAVCRRHALLQLRARRLYRILEGVFRHREALWPKS